MCGKNSFVKSHQNLIEIFFSTALTIVNLIITEPKKFNNLLICFMEGTRWFIV